MPINLKAPHAMRQADGPLPEITLNSVQPRHSLALASGPKTRHSGQVTWFDTKHGYGFLACGHESDIFVDARSIEWQSRYRLRSGDWVDFNIVESDVGPKARLVNRNNPGGFSPSALPSRCREFFRIAPMPPFALVERKLHTILLIESDDEVRAARSEFLSAAGYFVAICPDAQLARESYMSLLPIDLVIVGLCPKSPLARYVEELKFLNPHIPVLMSAQAVTLDLWRETQLRDWHFLPDASTMPLLLSAVYSLLCPTRQSVA